MNTVSTFNNTHKSIGPYIFIPLSFYLRKKKINSRNEIIDLLENFTLVKKKGGKTK